MTGIKRGVGLALVAMLFTACGGGGDAEEADDPSVAETSAATAEPTPAESDECRSTMGQAETIATELETATIKDGMAFGQFEDRLTALYEQANGDCTARVVGDFTAAMESMARVGARYSACSFSDPMFQCDVGKDLVEGTGLIHDAAEAANRTI